MTAIWDTGVGRETPGESCGIRWKLKEYTDKLAELRKKHNFDLEVLPDPSDDTIRHWKAGVSITQERLRLGIRLVCFGDPPRASSLLTRLETLVWANDARSSVAPGPATRWEPHEPWYLRDDFARMYVAPQAGDDRCTLTVSVSLSEIYVKLPAQDGMPALSVTVRPARVEVRPREENVQPVDGTVLGRDREHEDVRYAGGGWLLENPKGRNENPLAGIDLCDLQCVRTGPHGVSLALRCQDRDLGVEVLNAPPELTDKKEAVLRRVLQRMHCDPDTEYVDLASSGLHRSGAR